MAINLYGNCLQMLGVDATPHLAQMVHFVLSWNGSHKIFIGHYVRERRSTITILLRVTTRIKIAKP